MFGTQDQPTKVSAESHIAAMRTTSNEGRPTLCSHATSYQETKVGAEHRRIRNYHYKYASGHEGDSALSGLPCGDGAGCYIAPGFEGRDALLAKHGSTGLGRYVSTSAPATSI